MALHYYYIVLLHYIKVQTMAEGGQERYHFHRDRDNRGGGGRDYDHRDGGRRPYDDRDRRGGPPPPRQNDQYRHYGGGGGGRPYHDRRPPRGGGGPNPRRTEDRFRLFRLASSHVDWKGDPVDYSKEQQGEASSPSDAAAGRGPPRRRPNEREDGAIQHSLRLLWSASPEPPSQKEKEQKKQTTRTRSDNDESSSGSDSGSSSESSSSSSSSSEESRRRRRKKRSSSKRRRRQRHHDSHKKRSRRRRYSSSSASESSNSASDDDASEDSRRASKRRKQSTEGDEEPNAPAPPNTEALLPSVQAVGASTATGRVDDSDDDDDSVGPRPPPADAQGDMDFEGYGGAGGRANYGKALLPGEGSAMAQFVQNNMRVPRRGEIGYGADEIDRFENSGYVMSGSRHARMNAVRIRKENQVYTAEEQRALAMIQLEEKAEKEKALVQDFRSMLEQKLRKSDET